MAYLKEKVDAGGEVSPSTYPPPVCVHQALSLFLSLSLSLSLSTHSALRTPVLVPLGANVKAKSGVTPLHRSARCGRGGEGDGGNGSAVERAAAAAQRGLTQAEGGVRRRASPKHNLPPCRFYCGWFTVLANRPLCLTSLLGCSLGGAGNHHAALLRRGGVSAVRARRARHGHRGAHPTRHHDPQRVRRLPAHDG